MFSNGKTLRIVMDTNIWVSYLLNPESGLSALVRYIYAHHRLLYSADALLELTDVLSRKKFEPYIAQSDIQRLLTSYALTGEEIKVTSEVTLCRDADDNYILALALDGRADLIVSGDNDMLALHPFQGIAIFSPAETSKQMKLLE